MDQFDIVSTVQGFATDIIADVNGVAPVIATVVVAVAGVTVGIKYLRKFIAKV